ncbi:MAG: 4'-phosphopantetheinyl transferase superfamily protein [Pigmentiphaga sp.]
MTMTNASCRPRRRLAFAAGAAFYVKESAPSSSGLAAPPLTCLNRPGGDAPLQKVEVFLIDIGGDAETRADLEVRFAAWLTPQERERIARLRRAADRRRGLVARAALRSLLAHRLGTVPAAVPIAATPAGKPILAGASGADTLHFSVSHSGGRVAIALGRTPLGVDIEEASTGTAWPDAVSLATAWFEPEEARRVAADPAAFLSIWTAKEAVLKARGRGLAAHGLRGFVVPFASSEPQPVRCVRPDGAGEWFYVSTLAAGAGYRAALAVFDDAEPAVLRSIAAADLLAARLAS